MSFKIPCGGFRLDEESFSLDDNGALSIPKPLTYDYMPEGYPSKSVETVTLMEEQEVTFSDYKGTMTARPTVALDIKAGDKLTVVWDGVSYDVTVKTIGSSVALVFGNPGLTGAGDAEDYPFVYMGNSSKVQWGTADTAPSHTISVKTTKEVITPMAEDFLPSEVNELIMNSSTPDSTKKFRITVDDSGTLKATEI